MPGHLVLEVLYEPSEPQDADLDVIFVHGLGGGLTETWTHKGSNSDGQVWPRDLLKTRLPLARVMAYGYDGSTHLNDSVARIRDHARTLVSRLAGERDDVDPARPIIFVAHCLGGLIIKQALCFANTDENHGFKDVARATAGILLFGTPNFGTTREQIKANANAFAELERIPKPAGSKPLAGIAMAIVAHSADLKEIQEDFCQLQTKYEISSWYEMRMLPGAKTLVVDQLSACSMVPNENRYPVDANHINMCRFANAKDNTFKEVCKAIKRAVDVYNSKLKAAAGDTGTCNEPARGGEMRLAASQPMAGLRVVGSAATVVCFAANPPVGNTPMRLLERKREDHDWIGELVGARDSVARGVNNTATRQNVMEFQGTSPAGAVNNMQWLFARVMSMASLEPGLKLK